jgi:hypothetical protein
MNYELIYRADLGSAHSPFRVISQPSGREVDWINRFLDQCCIRGLAWHTLRGYAFDLTHFIRWWADRHSTDEVTEQALTSSSLLDYMRYQARPTTSPRCQHHQHTGMGGRTRFALPIPRDRTTRCAGLSAVLLATVQTWLWPLASGVDTFTCKSSQAGGDALIH